MSISSNPVGDLAAAKELFYGLVALRVLGLRKEPLEPSLLETPRAGLWASEDLAAMASMVDALTTDGCSPTIFSELGWCEDLDADGGFLLDWIN